jgi:acetyl-CoA acetyltransferase
MIPFAKPGKSDTYDVMGAAAARAALADARVGYEQVQQAYAGSVYTDSTSGQATLYPIGMTGIPVINVDNNCATGSTALYLARQAIEGGAADCVLALGFEQMVPGAPKAAYADRPSPLQRVFEAMTEIRAQDSTIPRNAQLFGGAALAYMEEFGIGPGSFAAIAVKARRHAAGNPYAVFRDPVSLEDVMNSPNVFPPLTRLQCCPPTCGAAAAILCSVEFAQRHGLDSSVRIVAQSMQTDQPQTFSSRDMRKLVGYDLTARAAAQVYEAAGISPEDLDVVELHDCFTANELLTYEALGLTAPGTAERFIAKGDNTYGGKVVTNPSGGLLSKGHPIGATGLAQCAELVWQLRGHADRRQVPRARTALQHNLGLGSACVVTLYQKH